ncbi:MAG TPA: polyphosphate kinase 1 [Spirochaetia bacterium]|nr:polyphosphate kinase 1 [Spirochaetales bacterium]HRY78963.1 polyphosphate kinase 1 [Spirochaetia bacterium]
MIRDRFFNRELSWLEFNDRVLEEGLDPSNPPLERLKFLSIVSSNMDEFFMVRVAGIKAQIRDRDETRDAAGLSPEEQLAAISARVREIQTRQYRCLTEDIFPALAAEGLCVVRPSDWTGSELRWLEAWFARNILPVLTPLRMDDGEGVPSTGNLRMHAAFLLEPPEVPDGADPAGGAPEGAGGPGGVSGLMGEAPDGRPRLVMVTVPPNLDRFVRIPSESGRTHLALLDEVILTLGHALFPGYRVLERNLFKVARDAAIGVDEGRDDDFVAAMEEVLANRQNSWPVRMTLGLESPALRERLREVLGLSEEDVYELAGPIDLRSFMELATMKGFDRLRYPARKPVEGYEFSEDNSIFDQIRKGDLLLHVPYESFAPVEEFVRAAADDPNVLAVKMTLYRTSGDSPLVRSLTRAAGKGKQVTVMVELKARFDEAKNIEWASSLEQAGAVVVYGVARLKVHAKACLVVRREEDGSILRYVHLSTGNYNDKTARLYSDLSFFTINETLCREAGIFFNMLTGLSAVEELRTLAMAPFSLKRRIIAMIDREADWSSPETPGLIMAKMNSLCDPDVVAALYRASRKGVRILLNVRGICILVPGVEGLSETVTVVSVVGRFLEHSRIFYFRNGGAEELYLASADWMPRNLERRVELMFPVPDPAARDRVLSILQAYFRDTVKARILLPSGAWERRLPEPGREPFSAQDWFWESERNRFREESEAEERVLTVRRRAP